MEPWNVFRSTGSVNPCFHDNGGCGDVCTTNAFSRRICSCNEGTYLSLDGAKCLSGFIISIYYADYDDDDDDDDDDDSSGNDELLKFVIVVSTYHHYRREQRIDPAESCTSNVTTTGVASTTTWNATERVIAEMQAMRCSVRHVRRESSSGRLFQLLLLMLLSLLIWLMLSVLVDDVVVECHGDLAVIWWW